MPVISNNYKQEYLIIDDTKQIFSLPKPHNNVTIKYLYSTYIHYNVKDNLIMNNNVESWLTTNISS